MNSDNQLFKKIKSIFILDDASSPEPKETKGGGTSQPNPTTNEVTNKPLDKNEIEIGNVSIDTKFNDLLLKAIENSNLDGFDYLEFKNSLKSVEKVIPDETMRYTSAFEMAKTMGITKEKLIKTAEHYAGVLKTEADKFSEAVANQRKIQISGRQDQLNQIAESMKQKQEMIAKLTKELDDSKKQLTDIQNQIESANVKISTTEKQFSLSYALIDGQILEDIQKIKNMIP
ncbi:MAG: hypothetical protein R2774_10925 [Saprospiraceae bacterium]